MKLLQTGIFLLAFFFAFCFIGQPAQAQIYTTDKLITVDLHKQMLYAWQGGHIVYASPATTGLPHTPTVTGTFHIYWKLPFQDMRGDSIWYGPYNIKNVPNVMYFYQDYAIHGAPWRTYFGVTGSHGCINLPVYASAWLYNWASLGTTVYIY